MYKHRSIIPNGFPPGVLQILFMDFFVLIFQEIYKFAVKYIKFLELTMIDINSQNLHVSTVLVRIMYLYSGWQADSYLGKYLIYVLSISLYSFIYIPFMIVTISTTNAEVRYRNLYSSNSIKEFLEFGTILKIPIVAEQFEVPAIFKKFQLYLFYNLWIQNIGIIIANIIIPLATDNFQRYTIFLFDMSYIIGLLTSVMLILLFIKLYTVLFIKKKYPFIVEKMIYCTYVAVTKRAEFKGEKSMHWVDYAYGFCKNRVIKNTKYFFKALMIIAACAPYWALRDIVEVKWTFLANILDNELGSIYFYPHHLQAVPAILNVILIPIAYKWIYPLGESLFFLNTPLKSFGIAYFCMGCAFVCSGFLNIFIERHETRPLRWGEGQLKIYNGLSFTAYIDIPWAGDRLILSPYDACKTLIVKTRDGQSSVSARIMNEEENYNWYGKLTVYERVSVSYIIKEEGLVLTEGHDNIYRLHPLRPKAIVYCANDCGKGTVAYISKERSINFTTHIPQGKQKVTLQLFGLGDYFLYINGDLEAKHKYESGEVQSLLLYTAEHDHQIHFSKFYLVKKNVIKLVSMIPQYFFVSLADIFGYVPFNILLFTESPPHLRGLTYSIYKIFIFISYYLLLTFEYYIPKQSSFVAFNESLLGFMAFLLYLYLAFHVELKTEFDD